MILRRRQSLSTHSLGTPAPSAPYPRSVAIYLGLPVRRAWAVCRSKVDGFVPHPQHVKLRTTVQAEWGRARYRASPRARSKALLTLGPPRRLRRCANEPGSAVPVHTGFQLSTLATRLYMQDAGVRTQLPKGVRLPCPPSGKLMHLSPWTSGVSGFDQSKRGLNLS